MASEFMKIPIFLIKLTRLEISKFKGIIEFFMYYESQVLL